MKKPDVPSAISSQSHNLTISGKDIAYHFHSYTNPVLHEEIGPQIISKGQGIYVYDEAGKKYIEGMAGLWCTSLGFSEERLIEAATKQMRQLPFYHTFNHRVAPIVAELAERLIDMAPVPMSKAYFTNSGSEANDSIIKLIWYYNNALGRRQKKKIISRHRAYHGVTIATASLTGRANSHIDFDLPMAGIIHTDCPHFYRQGLPGETEADFGARCADNLEKLILKEGPETIAAFIAEPVMAAGGVIIPPKGYFDKVQAVLKKYDILLIADEVVCGFGRTGKMFGCELYNLKPDFITLAKGLSSAYLPIGAVLISGKIYEVVRQNADKIGTFAHGFTYSGHPVSAAVAVECLKIYEEENTLNHIQQVSVLFQKQLQALQNHPLVGEVRGIGLLGGVELVADKKTRRAFDVKMNVGRETLKFLLKKGLILRNYGDTITCCPPLIINAEQITMLFKLLWQGLDDTQFWLNNSSAS